MTSLSRLHHVTDVTNNLPNADEIDVFLVAAGFEERSFDFLSKFKFSKDAICILSLFDNQVDGNLEIEKKYLAEVRRKFRKENIRSVRLALNEVFQYKSKLRDIILSLPHSATRVTVDISGLPAYAICAVLDEIRECRPYETLSVIYTSAVEYTPTLQDYLDMQNDGHFDKELLPPSMSKEMSENLTFAPFAGHLKGEGKSCLALFAGYEVHRSAGVIESINPSMLLLIYGDPSDDKLSWRLELSRRLHAKFERTRKRAIETVQTHQIDDSIRVLERYYNYLIDDYDLIVSPVCSKLQVVACYLFWEKYQEVQLTFPLPIGYDPTLGPRGSSKTLMVNLGSRVRFNQHKKEYNV